MWVRDDGGEGQVDDVGETSVEQVDGGKETSHVDGGTRVSNTVCWHVDEQLGETAKSVWDGFPPERDGRNQAVVDTGWVSAAVPAARVGLVSLVAEYAVADASKSRNEETRGDTRNRAVVDFSLAESRVQSVVENWAQENDAERVEVANDIVRDTVAGKHRAQEVGGASNTVVVPVLHGEEAEHSSGLERTLDVLDELVVVAVLGLASLGLNHGWLGCLPPARTTDAEDTTARQAAADHTNGVWQIGAAWLVQVKSGLEPDEEKWQWKVEDQRQQESQPPADVLGGVGGRSRHEGADVDQKVEPQHDTFSGVLRVFNDSLAGLEDLDLGHVALDLIQKQWRHVWLEHGSSDGQNVDTDEEGDLGGSVVDEFLGTSSNDEDVANTTDNNTPENHWVATKSGISEVSDDERQAVSDKTEGLGGGVGDLLAEAERTLSGLGTSCHSTIAVSAWWEWSVDVVGPDLSASVIRGTLAELNGTEKVGDGWDVSGNSSQGLHLLVRGLALILHVQDGNAMVAVGRRLRLRLLDRAMLVWGLLVRRRVRAVSLDLVYRKALAVILRVAKTR